MAQITCPPKTPTARPRPPIFRALGAHEPPERVEVGGQPYQLVRVFKHDSWAATALYRGPSGQIVCKFNRQQSVAGLPMRWLGRRLARREAAVLQRLSDLPNVPRWAGDVCVNGRRLEHAVAHDYVPGHPLGDGERVNDRFFGELTDLLATMHRRGIAYVDLHKRENVIVGDDGRPYLIDFQISLTLPNWWPARAVLRMAQRSDDYHLAKHVARCRPDLGGVLPSIAANRPWWIRLHRLVARPFRACRRRLLVWCGVRTGRGRVGSEHFPEEVVRADAHAAGQAA
jgi:hypothetical protein